MQAHKTLTQSTAFTKFAVGLLITAAGLAAAIGITQLGNVEIPVIGSSDTNRVALVAHTAPSQGEGRVDGAVGKADVAASRLVIRYAAGTAGEGLLDRSNLAVTAASEAYSTEQIQFLEDNVWDYEGRAQVAG